MVVVSWRVAQEPVLNQDPLYIDGSGEKVGNDDPLKQSHASQQPGLSGSGADGGGSTTTVGGCEEPTAGIFIQTAAYLLDVHALKVWWLNI